MEKSIKKCIDAIIDQTISQSEIFHHVSVELSMYPIPNGFEGLPFFDIRFSLGSDRDHNLASK